MVKIRSLLWVFYCEMGFSPALRGHLAIALWHCHARGAVSRAWGEIWRAATPGCGGPIHVLIEAHQ